MSLYDLEDTMPAPLSIDLRQRIWDSYCEDNQSASVLARRFRVSSSAVSRLIARAKETGAVATFKPGPKGPSKFLTTHRQAVRQWLDEMPDLYLHELQTRSNAILTFIWSGKNVQTLKTQKSWRSREIT